MSKSHENTLKYVDTVTLPHLIISYHTIISFHIIPYHTTSYHTISVHIISYRIISYHIISYHIISYHIISYHIISYHESLYHHAFFYHMTPALQCITYIHQYCLYYPYYPCIVYYLIRTYPKCYIYHTSYHSIL